MLDRATDHKRDALDYTIELTAARIETLRDMLARAELGVADITKRIENAMVALDSYKRQRAALN